MELTRCILLAARRIEVFRTLRLSILIGYKICVKYDYDPMTLHDCIIIVVLKLHRDNVHCNGDTTHAGLIHRYFYKIEK